MNQISAAPSDQLSAPISIATWNIHKGFSPTKRHMVVHDLRERLRQLNSDIVFLQEVQGVHWGHARRHADWPAEPQHEFLAADVWGHHAYGCNMVYDHGHHGNAILSRFPIRDHHNQDITHFRFEKRGLLHCVIDVSSRLPHLTQPLHCVCVHLSLFGRSRRYQLDALADRIESIVPAHAPLLIAGDFNDWRNQAHSLLADRLGLVEIFAGSGAKPGRSFPSALPIFRLDRIYLRGLTAHAAEVHHGPPWSSLSDHAALSAQLVCA